MRSNINGYYNVIPEWIPYDQFSNIKKIGQGGFSTVYSAIWNDGPLIYNEKEYKYERKYNEEVALKCLYNSQNIPDKFLNEIKKYSTNTRGHHGNILEMFGISQDPNTKNYIMVLKYAEGGDLNNWITNYYKDIEWREKMKAINKIIYGISLLHNENIVHRDLHIGNILATGHLFSFDIFISDFGLCGDINDMNKKRIYGVIPYIAPEVLRGKPYTKAADIYSFGMIMYFIATGRQPFADLKHDRFLVREIVLEGVRPKIEEWEAPKEYIDIMKSCWDPNPDNRPIAYSIALDTDTEYHERRRTFFKDFDEDYYKKNISKNFKSNQSTATTPPQYIYKSQLVDVFTD
ncbi:kinase-like domain-containing protein [Rhizophagus diaphanus]|nr:kinase-like domain-containing protein [Rhizophagus diaphanus] [Rhizophagus sp. MUCL 43196]